MSACAYFFSHGPTGNRTPISQMFRLSWRANGPGENRTPVYRTCPVTRLYLDLRGIEPRSLGCKPSALPLSYRPTSRVTGCTNRVLFCPLGKTPGNPLRSLGELAGFPADGAILLHKMRLASLREPSSWLAPTKLMARYFLPRIFLNSIVEIFACRRIACISHSGIGVLCWGTVVCRAMSV